MDLTPETVTNCSLSLKSNVRSPERLVDVGESVS